MTILPLIGRQLRVQARSPAVHWTRFGAALAGTLVCLTTLSGSNWGTPLGALAFEGLETAAFVLCCLAGLLTVDGISRERREGTLGLLFLTRVRSLDVLLANFGGAGIASLWALAALTPLVLMLVLFAGATRGEAARKVLALFDTMILSLAAGLWASAGGRGWWSCVRSAAGMLLLVILGPLLLESLLQVWWPGPLSALEASSDRTYRISAVRYWGSIGGVLAITWLLMIGAGRRLRRALCEDDEPASPSVASAPAPEPMAAGEAPLEWMARRQNNLKPMVWSGVLLGAAFYGGLFFSPDFMWRILASTSSWGMTLAITVAEGSLFGWAASRFFIEVRQTGELELLLTTPEGARTLVASQWKWLKNMFSLPLVVFVAPWVLLGFIADMRWGVLRESSPLPATFDLYSIPAQMLSCVNTMAGLVALLWTGMWLGWTERSQARAIARVVILAKGVPYLMGLLGLLVSQKLVSTIMSVSGQSRWLLMLVWAMPQFVILLFYIGLIRWARRRLGGEAPRAWADQ